MVGYLDVHVARADATRALALTGADSPFTITVRSAGGLTRAHQDAFAAAADRWARVIVGDLPTVELDGEVIDGLLVVAAGQDLDDDVLGVVGPTHVRADGTPCRGEMLFDTAALDAMARDGVLVDVVTREMGHVLGVGTLWNGLVHGADGGDPRYTGPNAMAEYGRLTGGDPEPVPVENDDGEAHWRGSVFPGELMSGAFGTNNVISRLTVASLKDLGYGVDLDAAEPYALNGGDAAPWSRAPHRVLRPPRTTVAAWSVGGGGGRMEDSAGHHDSGSADGYFEPGVGGGGGELG